jgi:hypothetical protein
VAPHQSQKTTTHDLKCKLLLLGAIGLHNLLDGDTNPEYKLLGFIQLTEFFLQREEGTSF